MRYRYNPHGRRTAVNRLRAARLTVGRVVVPPRLRCWLRWQHGRERLALWLDRFCAEDTP